MGMILTFFRVTPAELVALRQDGSQLFDLEEAEDTMPDGAPRAVDVDKAWNAIQFLLTGRGLGDEAEPQFVPDRPAGWWRRGRAKTRVAQPAPSAATPGILDKAIFSGDLLGEDTDNGVGPAQVLSPGEVRELAAALTDADIAARYDQQAMQAAELYPAIDWDADDLEYVRSHFEAMREHLAGAAKAGDAVVQHLT